MTNVMRGVAVALVTLQVALFVWMVALWSPAALLVFVCGVWTFFGARSIWRNCDRLDELNREGF